MNDSVFTGQNGAYFKYVPMNWTGTVVPSKIYYTFNPSNRSYTNVAEIFVAQNYTATAVPNLHYFGIVRFVSGGSLAGVKIAYSGSQVNDSVFTNTDGFYTFTVPQGWTGISLPVKAGYTFYPTQYSYTNVNQTFTNQNFTAFQGTTQYYSIEGTVRLVTGAPLAGVKLTFTGPLMNDSAFTGQDGKYFKYVPANWTGTVVPTLFSYTFAPENRSYSNVNSIITQQDYTATQVSSYTISDMSVILQRNVCRG